MESNLDHRPSYPHSAGKRNRMGPEQRPLMKHTQCEGWLLSVGQPGSRLLLEAASASAASGTLEG